MVDPRRHTVPIYDYHLDPNNPERIVAQFLGSGVFLLVNDRPLIITAAHLFEDGLAGWMGFGLRVKGKWMVVSAQNMPYIVGNAEKNAGNAQEAVYKDEMDVAVITPTEGMIEYLREQYVPYSIPDDPADLHPRHVVVHGWPSEWHAFDEIFRNVEVSPINFDCPVGGQEDVAKAGGDWNIHSCGKFDREVDFVLGDGSLATMPPLAGVSGCGVWCAHKRDDNSVECYGFAGMAVEHHKHKDVLLFIRAEKLMFPLALGLAGPRFYRTDTVRVADDSIGHFEGRIRECAWADINRVHWYFLEPIDPHTPEELFKTPVPEHALTKIGWERVEPD